jgi:ketosteroid isomerase-like protein
MKSQIITICLAAVSMLPFESLIAQKDMPSNLEEARKAISASNDHYFQAFENNDASLFVSRYAEDCWIMLPNAPTLCGPNAAKDFLQRGYEKFGIRNGKLITADVYGVSEDVVAEVGFYKLYNIGNIEFDDGKFIVLWKKTPQGWKMWRESFNSSRSRK